MIELVPEKLMVKNPRSVIKTVIMAILAATIVLGTFILENKVSALQDDSEEKSTFISVEGRNEVDVRHAGSDFWDRFAHKYDLKNGDTIKTNDSTGSYIYFSEGGLTRLAQNTEVTRDSNLKLSKGQAWVNTLYAGDDFDVLVGDIRISPFNSIFDVKLEAGKVVIYAHKRNVRVSFYDSGVYLNSILVTEGNRIDVNLEKLTEKLSKVLHSKLVKEFHYGKLSDESLSGNTWYTENIGRDGLYFDRLNSEKIQALRDQPLHNISTDSLGYKLKTILYQTGSYLILDDSKRASKELRYYVNHIYDLEHLYAYFSFEEADRRIAHLEELLGSYSSLDFSYALLKEFKVLNFVTPGSDLFDLREYIRSMYLDSGKYQPEYPYVVRTYLSDAFSAKDDADAVRDFVDLYHLRLKSGIEAYDSQLLLEDNQIFDNLLLGSDTLYRDKFFAYKTNLEEQWLGSITDEAAKKEERRMIIGNKIMYLKRVRDYFLSEKISLDDTKSIVYRLFGEIEANRVDIPSAAVDEMFTENLSDLGIFWDFLNSREYSISLTHGTTRQDRYNAFLGVQKGESGLASLKKKILGEDVKIEEGSVYDAKKEVVDAFSGIGVEDISLGEVTSYSQRFVDVYGVLSDVKFSCSYDREGQFLTDVLLEGELLTTGIKLEKLQVLIDGYKQNGEVSKDASSVDSFEVKVESKDEKIAKLLMAEKLNGVGFTIDRKQVEIIDLEKGLFKVTGEKYTVEVDSEAGVALKITLHLEEFDKELEDEIPLEELFKKIESEMIVTEE